MFDQDEEDEFDKAAFGLDGSEEDRLYMKGINDSDRTLISSKSLPLSLHELKKSQRDPRANHSAARARLEEDAKVAAETSINMANMQMTDNWKATEDVGVGDMKENFIGVKRSSEDTEAASEASATSDDKARIKPIKRVRFALDVQEQGSEVHSDNEFIRPKPISTFKSQVPDYILNPSKYTHYTLDWSVEDNDNSNVEAFKSCSETLQKTQEEFCSSEEVFGKIQFVHKHEKTSSNIQKDSMEDADRTSIAISRTMCVEHVDTENEDGEDLNNDEAIEIEAKSSTSIMNMFMERSVTRTVKNFRSKRESDVEEGT
ncbi:hypothetical protein KP509_11G066900 [Ceratopteris richardii]|uniref:U5 small nuclear ribonucleoprotein TSSC4 n=1 Tax=Ceratopteris richardii TaxID=49495 RepID=A0A8T2TTU7_CERRI|nr:hypothetical protein KP509_11G066900 [Ceratopteris richardii]